MGRIFRFGSTISSAMAFALLTAGAVTFAAQAVAGDDQMGTAAIPPSCSGTTSCRCDDPCDPGHTCGMNSNCGLHSCICTGLNCAL
jgi:hypothetical protein